MLTITIQNIHLDINGFIKPEFIEKCYNEINVVDCRFTNVKKLPLWPNVEKVICVSCNLLEELPLWPNVTEVNCNQCPLLTKLPPWPNIEEVICFNCKSLTILPRWSNIKHIWCTYCPRLIRLPYYIKIHYICEPKKFTNYVNNLKILLLSEYKNRDIKTDLLRLIRSYL